MHRFFLSPDHFNDRQVTVTDKQFLHQWMKVLRFKVGDEVMLCDGNQNEYKCKFSKLNQKQVVLEIQDKRIRTEKFSSDVHLYLPILNNQNKFEMVLEKGTEMGVKSFTPIVTRRTQVKSLRKFDRLLNIVREAAEQSGRTILPQVNEITSLEPALKSILAGEDILLGYVGEVEKLYKFKTKKNSVYHVFIGPEGDFDKDELIMFKKFGAIPFSLGKQVLRAETAAMSAIALLLCR